MSRLGRARPQRNILPFRARGTSASLSGTAIAGGVLESEIVTGGETLIITLNNDEWIAAGAAPIGSEANTQALIDGFDSAQVEAAGWNAEVRDKSLTSEIVRTSATIATWTIGAAASYVITANETITLTIPAEVLVTSNVDVTASATFDVTNESVGVSIPIAMYHYMHNTGSRL